jgi:superfamily I DNA/RNA helicase
MPITLSPQQAPIIDAVVNTRRNIEIKARAGTGKTFTLIEIVKAIRGASLGQVALMAFNKDIAVELQGRLESLGYTYREAEAGTCHSFGLRTLKKLYPSAPYAIRNSGYKANANKVRNLINAKVEDSQEETVWNLCGSAIEKLVKFAKGHAVGHLTAIDDQSVWFDIWSHYGIEEEIGEEDRFAPAEIVAAAIRIYKESLELCREDIDFDDMILAPLFFKARFWQFDFVMIDESQDTNPARRALALAMVKPRTGRVIYVGDEFQSIYGFTGASVDSMDQLRAALNPLVFPLTNTYRCPKAVVALAATIVPDFTAADTAPEGKVSTIRYEDLAAQNLTAADAILCRTTAPLVTTAYQLISNGIACRVAGKDIAQGLIKLATRWKVKTLAQLETKLDDYIARESAKLSSKEKQAALGQLEDNVECVRVMIARCRSQDKHNVNDLVNEIYSMFGDEKEMAQKQLLTLMTAHRSKGLEWNRVFILGRATLMPSPYAKKAWEQAQERHIEYESITRAKQELIDVALPPRKSKK